MRKICNTAIPIMLNGFWLLCSTIPVFADEAAYNPDTEAIGALVQTLTESAQAGDLQYLNQLLDEPYRGQEKKLADMILQSNMQDTYMDRLQPLSEGRVRLNYHYHPTHFQVDLAEQDQHWTIQRIWFCR